MTTVTTLKTVSQMWERESKTEQKLYTVEVRPVVKLKYMFV